MDLTAKQVELLKQKIESLNTKLSQLEKEATENHNSRVAIIKELEECTRVFLSAATLESKADDVIGLGSKFTAAIDFGGSKDVTDYLISDASLKVPGYLIIPTKAPLTQAVMGLKENDDFNYSVNGACFNGKILSIHKHNVLGSQKTKKR